MSSCTEEAPSSVGEGSKPVSLHLEDVRELHNICTILYSFLNIVGVE